MKKSSLGEAHSRAATPHCHPASSRASSRAAPPGDWVQVLRVAHPHSTAKHVAARTGWPVATVKKWLAGESEPSFAATVALVRAYGAEFLKACLPGVPWLTAAAAHEQRDRLRVEILAVEAELRAMAREIEVR